MPITPEQANELLDCMCPGDVPNELFKQLILAYLSAVTGGTGIVVTTTLPTVDVSDSSVVAVTDVTGPKLGANPARKGGWAKNISDVPMWIALGPVATITGPTLVLPGAAVVFGVGGLVVYTGTVSAIHNSGAVDKSLELVEF